jgi:FAD/FMN-containing dehydrogenase
MTPLPLQGFLDLRAALSGSLLMPADAGYDDARRVHNGLIDKRPAAIARCQSTPDVVDALLFGRRSGLEISVRGGGHNPAGRAVTEGGLMIDLAPMKGIWVDPAARTVRAQAGVTWREYNRAAALHGLATTGGVVSTTGIAGLTLGGGLGWLMGKHGMAVDNLISAEVVTAAGKVVRASADSEPDLFWALRGGGGNFGIVTSFEFRAHPLSTVIGGIVVHPFPAAPSLLSFYRDLTPTFPDDLAVFAGFIHAPDGSGMKLCALAVCHAGDDPAKAEADVAPLRKFGPPVQDLLQRMPYPVANTLMDGAFPRGAFNYWKSGFLRELSDGAIQAIAAAFAKTPTPQCAIIIEHFHGAVTRVSPTATAFPHRERGFNVALVGQWTDRSLDDACRKWVRETAQTLQPFLADRYYVNYVAADEDDLVRRAYGPNYDRLAALKHRYDPDNVFRLNVNIKPAP